MSVTRSVCGAASSPHSLANSTAEVHVVVKIAEHEVSHFGPAHVSPRLCVAPEVEAGRTPKFLGLARIERARLHEQAAKLLEQQAVSFVFGFEVGSSEVVGARLVLVGAEQRQVVLGIRKRHVLGWNDKQIGRQRVSGPVAARRGTVGAPVSSRHICCERGNSCSKFNP